MTIQVEDAFHAAYLHYAGYTMQSCTTGITTYWKFEIPECDAAIVQEELHDSETTILYLPFVSALKAVQHAAKLARQNLGYWSNATIACPQGRMEGKEQR